MAYIKIHPRGFQNEFSFYSGGDAEIREAEDIVNNDVNAYADVLPETHPVVRRALNDARMWGYPIQDISEYPLGNH
jgi:hypothetical protein